MAKRKNARQDKYMNKAYYTRLWRMRLSDLACNMFPYRNMPEEINMNAVSKMVMLGGYAIFFRDKALDKYFCLEGALTGVDPYGYPNFAKPISKNVSEGIIFPEMKVGEECIIIYANKVRSSALPYIVEYADKLAELDVAIKMNTRAMKHPLLLKTTEQMKESVSTLMAQYEDDYYVVFTDKSLLDNTSLQTMDFKVSATEILNLQKEKETVVNEFFNLFGISGSVEKRERMISGEMNAMMEQVAVNREMWMGPQRSAIDQINKMYGLNIEIEVPKYLDEKEEVKEEKKEEIIDDKQ